MRLQRNVLGYAKGSFAVALEEKNILNSTNAFNLSLNVAKVNFHRTRGFNRNFQRKI